MSEALVTDDDLERELRYIRSTTSQPLAGVFGSDSMIWQLAREQAIFLGAGRALLLQLAHPWVASGIRQRSTTLADPIDRFHRTFNVMFTMVFGTLDQALDMARRLHHRHARVTGQLAEAAGSFSAGSHYWANEISALSWVHAALVETTLVSYELVFPSLRERQRERYYRECKLLARLFGIPQERLPECWADFAAYNETMWSSDTLTVGTDARAIVHALLEGDAVWLSAPGWYRAITTLLLPPRLREAYELPFGERERRQAETALTWIRHVYPFLPARLRCVPPYQEASARLSGKRRPDVLTGIGNRAWIGQPFMGESRRQGRRRMI